MARGCSILAGGAGLLRVPEPRQGRARSVGRPRSRDLLRLDSTVRSSSSRTMAGAIMSWLVSPDRPIATAGPRPRPLRHGLAARHARERCRSGSKTGRVIGPGIYDMKAGLAIFLLCMDNWNFDSAAGPTGPAPDLGAVHLGRGDRQPDVARPDRGPGATMRLRAGARAAAGRRQPEDRTQGRRPVPPGCRGEGRPRRRGARRRAAARSSSWRIRSCASRSCKTSSAGTTLNVGVIQGGTTTNVVPAEASADIDVRVATLAEARTRRVGPPLARADHRGDPAGGLRRLQPAADGAVPGDRRRCSSRPGGSARSIGLELTEGSTGGGSDGNFTAALGDPHARRPGCPRRRRARRRRAHPHRLPPRTRRLAGRAPARVAGRIMTMPSDPHRPEVDEIAIRRAETVADYRACQDAQRRAWGIGEDGYLIPIATMVGANLHGGLVLGAFLPDGEAVAMSFAFLGRIEGRLCLYSQLTGVVPGYQSQGLGYRIKIHQRDFAQCRGDRPDRLGVRPPPGGQRPFQPGAAGRVGRTLRRQHVRRADRRPQRRASRRIASSPSGTPAKESEHRDPPRRGDGLAPTCIDTTAEQGGASGLDAAPAGGMSLHFRRLAQLPHRDPRRHRAAQARAARAGRAVASWPSGRAFQSAFEAGYRAVSFVRDETATPRRVFYVLDRRPPP